MPSFLNWVRVEKVNSYTREVKEYFRIVRLESRRWGASCFINITPISFNSISRGQDTDGYTVNCQYSTDQNDSENSTSRIGSLVPKINNSVFVLIDLAIETKFFISRDFVDMIKFSRENLSSSNDFKEIFV